MIKDLGRVTPDCHGWVPVEDAMLATGNWSDHYYVSAEPIRVEGLTTHGRMVEAVYFADGQYRDRWCSPDGDVEYRLTHVRALR